METKNILQKLREEKNLSQNQLAEKLHVTRQAVSRWENGKTVPNSDMLKTLSREYDVSINTLLGAPRQLICQCCGMPLYEDSVISRETDGGFNEDYCKWCYTDGKFVYTSAQQIIEFLIPHLSETYPQMSKEEIRQMLEKQIMQLGHWKPETKESPQD